MASFDLIRHHRHNDRAFLYAFDLIELNGDDMRRDPLEVPSMMHERERSRESAATISGKRRVRSLPGRL